MKQKFWLVWCPVGVDSPKYRHLSHQSAVTEARRLAGLNPGKEFYVLRAEGCAVKDDIRYEEFQEPLSENDIPF